MVAKRALAFTAREGRQLLGQVSSVDTGEARKAGCGTAFAFCAMATDACGDTLGRALSGDCLANHHVVGPGGHNGPKSKRHNARYTKHSRQSRVS